ncbi:MAG: glycoside hydrolase family 5 protein [Myxococcota bacterium]|nr:glycoside hydrolase family 5 protein [Myxococcota bacterium]
MSVRLVVVVALSVFVYAGCGSTSTTQLDGGGSGSGANGASGSSAGGASEAGSDVRSSSGSTGGGGAGATAEAGQDSLDASLDSTASQQPDSGWGPDAGSNPASLWDARVVDGGTGASSFHCVNWAVNGDNYQPGPLVLSAMGSASDSYAQVQSTSNGVLGAFLDLLGANCVRIPVNEPTATGAWWSSCQAVIDTATAKGIKVIIAYWVKDSGHGQPYDITQFYAMWQVVVAAYANNPLVYFDIHNEPFGFTQSGLITLVQNWIARFPNVPKSNVIVPGTGWDDNVTAMGAAFPGYLLQLHIYAIGKTGPLTDTAWASNVASVVGPYANRTIVGEWGNRVAGVNYDNPVNNDLGLAYVDGVSNEIHDMKMGSGFWPGLWAGPGNTSSWSLLTMNGSAPGYTFTVQSPSALKRVQHSWGLY